MTAEPEGEKQLADFFLKIEIRWMVTNLLLRSLIRRIADGLGEESGHRFTAALFDDASAAIDVMQDEGAEAKIAAAARALIDELAACVARDEPVRLVTGAAKPPRKGRGNGPKPPSNEPR